MLLPSRPSRLRSARVLLDLWAVVLAVVLTLPMVRLGGYGLARDMVFVPHHAWTADDVGLGTSLPRAVPLDAVLSLFTSLVDGAVIFRIAVIGTLVLAGWGAHRLFPDASVTARVFLVGAAVWNPYVVERLSLGQWALLTSYAVMWWLVPVVRQCVTGKGWRHWGLLAWWLGLGSLTPSGGMLSLLLVACVALATRRRTLRVVAVIAAAATFQLPWILPSVLGAASGLSDPRGVAAFAARPERPGGTLWSLLGTGGIWDRYVVPGSLTGFSGHLLSALCLLVLVLSVRGMARRQPGLLPAALVGFLLAGAAVLPGGTQALGELVSHIPGGGLLRDGQKWLAPYVVLVVSCGAESLGQLEQWLRKRDGDAAWLAVAAAVVLPPALLGDATTQTWQAVTPVSYPAALRSAMTHLKAAPESSGDVVTVPWQSYRLFTWGRPITASDPALRWSERPAVVSDSLRVASGTLHGEDARAAAVGRIVTGSGPLGARLAAEGIGWVIVYRDQPGAERLDLKGLSRVVTGREVALYSVDRPVQRVPGVGLSRRVEVYALDTLLLCAAGLGAGGAAGGVVLRGRRSRASS